MVRYGQLSSNVTVVQAIVGVSADGDFGPGTLAAVKSFQSSQGLDADGVVGAKTWSRLLSQVQVGSAGRVVVAVQLKLGISADGQFGPATNNAVRSFQSSKGLTADGIVGGTTWGALLGAGGASGTNPRNYTNGHLPDSVLSWVGFGNWRLATYCIADFTAMNVGYVGYFGHNIPISSPVSAYRTYDQQVELWNDYQNGTGSLAAYPGTSNHGWGLAVDIGVGGYGTSAYNWLANNAGRWGFRNDVSGEPWHWGYQR